MYGYFKLNHGLQPGCSRWISPQRDKLPFQKFYVSYGSANDTQSNTATCQRVYEQVFKCCADQCGTLSLIFLDSKLPCNFGSSHPKMASAIIHRASSSTTSNSRNYDVLSFRGGGDTRRNFTDHLFTTLTAYGIQTFRDDEDNCTL